MDSILRICARHNLKLIEDCANCPPGGEYKGSKLGTFDDLTAWSFFLNKNLAVGEVGMVVTRDPRLYQKCKKLRSHWMTVASFEVKGISVLFRHFSRGLPTYHIMPILLDEHIDRMKIVEFMKQDGIQTSIHYPAIQSFTAYRALVGPTPLAQYVSEHELTLPMYPTMTDAEVDLVCDALERGFAKAAG